MLLFLGQTAPLLANPTGGDVVAGSASIGAAGVTLTVSQATQNAIINWQTFSIANGETTKFIVPNSASATLNRVVGGNPSAIYGNLQSNGILYLVNPSGIVVGPSGRIDTASFLASTLDVSNQQFLAGGDMEFAGSSSAAINNAGVIHASTGDVYLIADQVNNSGKLIAKKGTVGLAAGTDVLYQQAGNEHLFIKSTPAGTTRATGVTNTGTIRAAAAELKAAGGNAYALAINNTGVIAATGYKKINGQVYLTSDGGSITNSCKISAKQANGNGGKIVLNGTAKKSATSGTVTNSGTLNASATVAGGKGGTISVKDMTGTTIHSGSIYARGGQGGAGGSVEVSGNVLKFTGLVDLTAPGGTTGTLLLDPLTLDVVEGIGGNIFAGENDPGQSTIGSTTVENALATANITLNADNGITIDAAILWSSGNTLTLSTNNLGSTITINAAIGGFNGSLVINTGGATDMITGAGDIEVNSFMLQNGSFFQGQAVTQNGILPIFSASTFAIEGSSSFLRVTGGDGNSATTAYQIADVYGLEGLGSPSGAYLNKYAELVKNIDATAVTAFTPIGSDPNFGTGPAYSGTFDGQGFTINGATISSTGTYTGLFGEIASGAVVKNVGATNLTIDGNGTVGGLAGLNYGTVSNDYTTGSVTGNNSVGGLVGYNEGTISNSYSVASVSGTGTAPNGIGGLVGYNNGGSISQSYSAGPVSAMPDSGYDIGGFSGANDGTISNSYSLGSVTVGNEYSSVGGFSGDNLDGTITNAYSTGFISIQGTGTGVSGFVGNNGHTITGSFWDESTSGFNYGVGGGTASSGVTGYSTPTLLSDGTYSSAGWSIGTDPANDTWVIFNGQTRPLLSIEYSTTITNAHQLQLIGINPTTLGASYTLANNIDLSGVTNAADIWGTNAAGGAGFVPIGNSSASFTGVLDGRDNVINGLYINSTAAVPTGLFGTTDATATVANIGLTNVDISASGDTGALVGDNYGLVENSYSTGRISGIGSLVCFGGLVGFNESGATTELSYSTVAVTVTNSENFDEGGLVGDNYGTVETSFATGAVSGSGEDYDIGGLIGYSDNTVETTYATGQVTYDTGVYGAGGLVGGSYGTISSSYFAQDAGLNQGVPAGGGTPETLAALTQQSTFQPAGTGVPNWDFTSTWTTDGDTVTPQLIGLPVTVVQRGAPSTDTLSGNVFTDNLGTVPAAADLNINLLSNGSVLLTTMTGPSGNYSFSVSSSVVTGGVLLTDTTDNGNTYYQANAPTANISGVDIWGNTLRIIADSASNTALATAAGTGTGNGVNFSVNGADLSTAAGVNISILSNISQSGVASAYTLDGNITAGGTLITAASTILGGSANVTLTGTSVALAGTFNRSGSLAVVSTTGDIEVDNVGTAQSPATASGVSLSSAGTVLVSNSYISTAGGDFTAVTMGSSDLPDGIDVANSVIDSQGGSISLTGLGTPLFDGNQGGYVGGTGVNIDNTVLETASSTDGETTGDITINGTGSAGSGGVSIPVLNNLTGVNITNSIVTVVDGALSITGDVNAGNAQAVLNEDGSSNLSSGYIFGVLSNDGSLITASGLGSVTITGDTTGSTAQLFNTGVDLSGLDSSTGDIANSFVSVAGGTTGLMITGTAGAVGNSPGGADVQTPSTTGVTIEFGANVTAEGAAPITIIGSGGTDENTSDAGLADESSLGISVNAVANSGGGGTPSVTIASAGSALTLTGTAGSSIGNIAGISVNSDGGASASITSETGNISFTGTAPNEAVVQVLSSTGSGGAAGVDISGDSAAGSASYVTASAGSIYIKGTVNSGSDNTKEAGVYIHDDAAVTASGTGGAAGNTAQGDVSIFGNTSGSTAQSLSGGVFIGGANTTVSASGLVADGTGNIGLTIDGTSSTIDGSTGATLDGHNGSGGVFFEPLTAGIAIVDGAYVSSIGASPITFDGNGGTNANTLNNDNGYVSPTDGGNSASYGVAVFSPAAGTSSSVSAGGQLTVMGTAGASPIDGVGVMIGGPSNIGVASLSAGTSVTITGNGGAGNAGTNVPNAGFGIFDPGNDSGQVRVFADGGNVTITGSSGGGVNSVGIQGAPYFNSVDGQPSFDPDVTASGSAVFVSNEGSIDLTGLGGGINAQNTSVTTPGGTMSTLPIGSSSGPLSLNGGDFNISVFPIGPVILAASTVQGLTVNSNGGLTITGAIDSSGPVTLKDIGGDITLAPGGSINAGGDVIVAAGDSLVDSNYIINDSSLGANAIQTSGGSVYLFSSDPASDTFGGFTVPPANVYFNALFSTDDLPEGNAEFFYAAMGATGPNSPTPPPTMANNPPPSTMTGGAAGGQSNIVPPSLTPTVVQETTTTSTPIVTSGGDTSGLDGGSQPPPISFTGTGISTLLGQVDGGLADSTSNSGLVGTGDVAQLGGGGLSNPSNPAASGAINLALGPIVYQNLADALKALGDWADVPDESGTDTASNDSGGETILTGGDVAEMAGGNVKNIPADQAPAELRNAMNGTIAAGQ